MWHQEKAARRFEDKRKPVLEVEWGVGGTRARRGGVQREKAGAGKQQHKLRWHRTCGE